MKKRRAKSGVTIIELVITIVIVGVLVGSSSMFIKETMDIWRFMSFRNEVVGRGRLALARMVREIRRVRDTVSVITATSSQFRFYDSSDTDIAFLLSGTNLMRNSTMLAQGVSGLTFTYYDANGASITSPAVSPNETTIKVIKISFTVTYGTQTKTVTAQVYPRNL